MFSYIPDLQASQYRDELNLHSKYNHVFKESFIYRQRLDVDVIKAVFKKKNVICIQVKWYVTIQKCIHLRNITNINSGPTVMCTVKHNADTGG